MDKPIILTMLNCIVFSIITTCCLYDVMAEKVLFMPLQQGSHTKLQQSIVTEMHARGHQVYTVLGSRFGAKFKDRIISSVTKIAWFQQNSERTFTGGNIDDLFGDLLSNFSLENQRKTWDQAVRIMNDDCIDMMADDKFLNNIRAIKFDMVVMDYWHPAACNLLLPHNLSIPFLVNSVGVLPWLMREPALPSFVPWLLAQKSDRMTFWERLENIYEHFSFFHMPTYSRRNTTLLEKYAPGIAWWNDLLDNSLLYIQIRNHILEWPAPTMPNNIRLFGLSYHKAKPLEGTVASVVSNSTADVIMVSFGTMGGKLPRAYVIKLLETFDRINKTFLFSHTSDIASVRKIPSNVFLFPWLPQNDILGHPKTKLFITHGGHNGQSEAVYHGVPMVNMPLYFDQIHNAFRIQDHKFGLTVNIHNFTHRDLENAINKVLYDPIYSQNVKRASEIVKSEPESKAIAANWIEHVMRFGGEHLRTSAFDMPWYQYFMLDILAFVVFVFIIVLVLIVSVIRLCFSFLRPKQKLKQQ